jgi:hypothetical protein
MQSEGVDVNELYDVDTVAEEDAEMLVFDATQNVWSTVKTQVKVARRMFAHGNKYGCIRMRDLTDGRTKVLKKSLAGQKDEDVYDEVKSHALAELCCSLFRQLEPDLPIGFMPRVIYKLVQRSNRPKIMCEELLTDEDDYETRPLSMFLPANVCSFFPSMPASLRHQISTGRETHCGRIRARKEVQSDLVLFSYTYIQIYIHTQIRLYIRMCIHTYIHTYDLGIEKLCMCTGTPITGTDRGLLPRVPFDLVRLVSLVHVYSPCYLPLSRAFHHSLAHKKKKHIDIEIPQ